MAFLLQDYKDLKEIARGGMGKVYLATQVSLNRKVVIKEMASGLLADQTEIRRFENEARAAAALDHDNIIRIYDFGEDYGSFYIAMEYMDGSDLEAILKSSSYLPEIGLMIALLALKGLNFAHQRGIIHRDIKPGNILVSKSGAVKVVDFGLAHANSHQLHLTTKDMIVGTPIFMAPEQATGEEKKDSRMDIWAAGVLLYRIVTNTYPFIGENVPALLVKIIQHHETPVQKLVPTVPGDLADVINLCLEKDRRKRLQSIEPLIEALQNYFYDMEIKDPSAWIRRYETDPQSCAKELTSVLIEYHLRKENVYRAAGDLKKADAHLEAAKKIESTEMSINTVRDVIKKRDPSAALKKTTRSRVRKSLNGKFAIRGSKALLIASLVFLAVICTGTFMVYLQTQKTKTPGSSQQIATSKGQQTTAPPRQLSGSAQTQKPGGSSLPDSGSPAKASAPEKAGLLSRSAPFQPAAKGKPGSDYAQLSHTVGILFPDKKDSIKPPRAIGGTSLPQIPSTPSPGILKITVYPASTEVFVDGDLLSAKEMNDGKRLKPGTHSIVGIAPGYNNFSKTITSEKGDVQIVSVNLVPLAKQPGALHIYSSPWAEVYVDGVFNGNSPTSKPIYLSDGPHSIILKRSGFKTYEEPVSIANGELKRLKIKLEKEERTQE